MPRLSGTYSAPAGQPVVNGDIIDATVHNNLITDLGNEITNSIPRDGTAPPIANLPLGGYKITGLGNGTAPTDAAAFGQILPKAGGSLTGAIDASRSTVIATATTTPLWTTASGNIQDWTGTPTITALPNAPQAGAQRVVYPAPGTIITHGGNVSVQGNASYTAQAGDEWTITAITTTTFYVTIKRSDGKAVSVATNKLINGGFNINQRGVSGTVVLTAGQYGHDRFKGGASGCTYTFSTVNNLTTLTISAGSLIQVVEGLNLQSGTHTLSWTGTATGKIGAGSYSASGVTGSITGGANTNVEFSTGTLSLVQLEAGSLASRFEHRLIGTELALCQRYGEVVGVLLLNGYGLAGNGFSLYKPFKVTKRVAPTLTGQVATTVVNCGIGTLTSTTNECVLPIIVTASSTFVAEVTGTFASAEL